jgi:hypothetical protein
LVHWNGWQRWFQASMKIRIARMRSATLVKVPRRIALRVMIPKEDLHQIHPARRVACL